MEEIGIHSERDYQGKTQGKGDHLQAKEREASDTLILDLQPPELSGNRLLLLKPSRLGSSVMVALAN